MYKNNLIFKVVGNRKVFKSSLVNLIDYAEKLTSENIGMRLNVALNYGGRQDIVSACKKISEKIGNNLLDVKEINEDIVLKNLMSREINDIDLLIRTSGEKRISNFLPWQLSYSELYFSELMWPDFNEQELEIAFENK